MNRPVLITGATGLVGGHLTQALLDYSADVVCLMRDWVPDSLFVQSGLDQRVKIVQGDICDQLLLERIMGEYQIQTVFHLAAQAIVGVANQNPISTFESNIRGTWTVLEACRRSPSIQQVVVASSDKAYGIHDVLPYTEKMPLQGLYPYDVSKSCSDLIAQSYAHTYDLNVAITRCGNFYGPGDLNWNRIVPGTIRSLLNDESPIIRSDGTYIRDYFFVEDGALAYILLAEHLANTPTIRGQAYNFSLEVQLTVLDLVEQVTKLMKKNIKPTILNQAKHEIPHQYLDARKARKELKWSPRYTLEEGLAKTVSWYQTYLRR